MYSITVCPYVSLAHEGKQPYFMHFFQHLLQEIPKANQLECNGDTDPEGPNFVKCPPRAWLLKKKLSWIFLAQQIVAMQRKLPRCEVSKKETQRGFDGKNERRRRSNEGQG